MLLSEDWGRFFRSCRELLFSFHSRLRQLTALFLDMAHPTCVHHKTSMGLVRISKCTICEVPFLGKGCAVLGMGVWVWSEWTSGAESALGNSQRTSFHWHSVYQISPNGKHWCKNAFLPIFTINYEYSTFIYNVELRGKAALLSLCQCISAKIDLLNGLIITAQAF